MRDWIATLPILLLVPVLMVPFIALAATGPKLSITSGAVVAGSPLVVTGTNFDRREYVELRWDGAAVAWLPVTKTDRSGVLVVATTLPSNIAGGQHELVAYMKQNGRNSKVFPEPVARLTVSVGGAVKQPAAAPVNPPPTVSTPAPTVAPRPTTAPTAVPVVTAKPSPTAAPIVPQPTAAPTAPPVAAPTAPPAPGSTLGYGARTVGGAGGRTIAVTNLNDSGPGSLRAALETSGPRTVTFQVGGTINLASDLKITDPFVTVAGETAPSAVVVRGAGTIVRTHEVIIRNLRFRPGDAVDAPSDVDALTVNGLNGAVYNVVIDHVSMVWGPDIGGLAILGDVRAVTVSNSIMGEGLYLSRHLEATAAQGGHSHAANVTQMNGGSPWPRSITFTGNLFTTSDTRIPRLQGAECVDIVNNVIYNWGIHAAHGNPRSLNLVGNWYRYGPESATTELWDSQTSAVVPNLFSASVYESGNVADGFTGSRGGVASTYATSVRCGGLSVAAKTPALAYEAVLAGAGAVRPTRDAVDGRIIANVRNRTGSFVNGVGYPAPNPIWP